MKSAAATAAMEERRRGQRVLLRVPAQLFVTTDGKEITLSVNTISVNHHGALLLCPQSIPQESQILLENCRTRDKIGCRVTRPVKETPDGFQIPIEFEKPAPNFWQIVFPPTDWRPSEDR